MPIDPTFINFYCSSFVFFAMGIILLVLVPLTFFACHKWRKLTAQTTNYVVNGASHKVSVDQRHKNGTSNGTLKKENDLHSAENGKLEKSNGVIAEKNGNEKIYPELNGKHAA